MTTSADAAAAVDGDDLEPVEDFRRRARAWLATGALPPRGDDAMDRGDDRRAVERRLQATLWEAGFAGICFPVAHGGLGLTVAHQRAFDEETAPYDMPFSLNVPTLGILAATLVELGTEEQRSRYLPAILRGDELWVQMLSEPSGGSDLAGVLTRADRDGDTFVVNGSKIWTSGADGADLAMCLVRTDWDVPKHRGLTMLIVDLHAPGVTIEPIRQVDGSTEFCQEFLDDVVVPVSAVVGEVGEGWAVASRLLVHERMAVGGASPYTSGRTIGHDAGPAAAIAALVRDAGRTSDPVARALVAESHVRQVVAGQLAGRVSRAMAAGTLPPAAGAMLKLFGATNRMRQTEIGLTLAGAGAIAWPADDPERLGDLERRDGPEGAAAGAAAAGAAGRATLWRQAIALGGGSNEIQRNIISERVLGMPREHAADHGVAYRDVPRTPGAAR